MNRHLRHGEIVEAARAGECIEAIVRRLHVCGRTVRRILAQEGVAHGRPRRRWTETHPSPRCRVRAVVL